MKKRLLHTLAALLLLVALPMTAQRVRAATYTVTNTNDSGAGSLREAIINANYTSGTKTIAFNIPKSDPGYLPPGGYWTIAPSSPLPMLTSSNIIIDGATQTANQGDTNPAGPEVHISGWYLGASQPIFLVTSSWNQILGLGINFADHCGVYISPGALGNRVKDSDIYYNGTGVIIVAARENIIANNLISWNDQYGIYITGSGANDNMIRRNTIGLNALGTAKAPNGSHGVYITAGAQSNKVGAGYYRNTISGNGGHGVYISGAVNNRVADNYIGVDPAGTGSHNVGNSGSGVAIDGGASSNEISDNTISGNGGHGVWISGSGTGSNWLYWNIIGADAQVTTPVPNGKHGVAIYDMASSNSVGHCGYGNVIVANSWTGVAIVNSDGNGVSYNAIGTNEAGTATHLGNNYYGVHIVGGSDNHIGLVTHIAYNGALPGRAGVRVEGSGAIGNTIFWTSIHDNSGKGIELVGGANGGLAAPTITQASCQQVQGSAWAGCTVRIYSDDADEGRVYEGSTTAHATTGAFSWSGLVQGPNVTATATDSLGNTSEFSVPFSVGPCPKVWVPLVLR